MQNLMRMLGNNLIFGNNFAKTTGFAGFIVILLVSQSTDVVFGSKARIRIRAKNENLEKDFQNIFPL